MKKLFTLLTLLVAIVTGAKAADEVVVIGSKNSGAFTITGTTHDVAGISGGTNSATLAAADDGQTASAGSKMGSTSNIGSKIVSGNKQHVSFTVAAGETVRFYYYQTSGANKSTTFATSRLDQSEAYYHAPTEYIAAAKNSLYYVDFVFANAGSYAISSTTGQSVYMAALKFTEAAKEAYKVTFNAGSNGTCATTELTEESAGAGITLPAAIPNEGYVFNGWFTAATGGEKIDDAGKTYHPSANVEIFAQYSLLAAPEISVTPTDPSTYKGVATTLTANVTGAPDPTVTWYKNTEAATTGGTVVGTGLTYQPDVTTEGEFYYYAVASNSEGTATSQLITLTVTDPNKHVKGNAYYMSVDEDAVAGENVYADDITMTIVEYEGGAANADNHLSGINSNYVAQISGSYNGWGTEFVAEKNGTLSVGVNINGGKTFTLTNVTSFDYNGVQDEGNNETSVSAGTNTSNTWKPSKKQWTVLTFDVVAGTKYKLSVAGSKMGFYGFNFTPESIDLTINPDAGATTVYSDFALDFSTLTNAKAYIETGKGDKLSWTQVTSAPAKTGLLVVSSETALTVPTAASSETDVTGNRLKGVATGESKDVNDGDNIYIFTLHDGKPGFIKSNTGRSLLVGKAYLDLGEEATGAREFFELFEDGTTTGISSIDNDQLTTDNDAPAYNLAGQKVGKGYKGIVIINGKKVVK